MKQIKPFSTVWECLEFLGSNGVNINEQIKQTLVTDLHYEFGEYIVILDTNNLMQK